MARDCTKHERSQYRKYSCEYAEGEPEEVLEELGAHHIEVHPHPVFENAFYLEGRPRLNNIPGFQNGNFEVQDAGSQQIGYFLNPSQVVRLLMPVQVQVVRRCY